MATPMTTNEVSALHLGAGAAHALTFDGVTAFAQAGGVDQFQLQTINADGLAQGVAGGAGNIGDDGTFAAGQSIQQRALASIRRPDQHCMQAIAQLAAALSVDTQLSQQGLRLFDTGAHLRTTERVQWFVGEVDGRFNMDTQPYQLLAHLFHPTREHTIE